MSNLKKIIILISSILLLLSLVFALKYNDMIAFDSPKYYKQAVEFYHKGDYQNAYYNFAKINSISPLYAASLFKQAVCAEKLYDYKTAIIKYNLLIDKFPKSIFSQKARYSLAKSYYYSNQLIEAEKEFLHIQKQGQIEDYIIASNYYLGLIYKENMPQDAKTFFINYISLAPNGTFTLASAEETVKLNAKLSPAENLIVAKVYFKNDKFDKALELFKNAEYREAWPYLSIIYKQKNMYKKSKSVFEDGYKNYSRNPETESLEAAIDNFVKIYNAEAKQGLFYLSNFVQEYRTAGEDYILYRLAKYLKPLDAIKLYSRIFYKYPKSEYASEAVWNLFWHEFKERDYKSAKVWGNEHLRRYSDSVINPRMLYWMAKLAVVQGKSAEANGYLNKILTKYPDDYYAFRADSLIKGAKNGWGTKNHHNLDERDFSVEFPISYSTIDIKDLKLINTLFSLEDYEIWAELHTYNKLVESWFEYKKGNKARSVLLARDGIANLDIKPPFSDDAYKLAYPIYWPETINDYSKDLRLDPYLMISIIREESYFNPEAKSVTNAIGLMQLMPDTARHIAAKYNLNKPTIALLKEPEENIMYGCNYYRYVKNSLSDKDLFAIAAYNGGPNAVKSWQERLQYEDFDEFVEDIPYPETKNYVKKVYRSYWNYLNIYNY